MRNLQKTLALFGMMVTGSIAQLAGCANDAQDCTLNYEACSTSGSSSSSSGVIPPPPECAALPSEKPEVILDTCAYFVGGPKASDDGDGNELTPLKSLQKAVELAAADKTGRSRVYVCGSVSERIEMTAGVSVFGGFDCTGNEWQYDPNQRATIAPAAPLADAEFQASVRIRGNGATNIEDVNIEAAAAVIDGGSSIAVIVDQATVHFARANLTAGDGKDGAKGATPVEDVGPNDPSDITIRGNAGGMACMGGPSGNPGGVAVSNALCPESAGGKGGNGQEASGDPGDDGLPTDATFGQGGDGEGAVQCLPGGNGKNGTEGQPGAGAADPGSVDATGYLGKAGGDGGKGTAGQGGGGGGGAKGKTNFYGASGGSGGAGGCAGHGGVGGNPGGASIGIVNLAGTLSFSAVKITTGAGGRGGDGGDGQFGGVGGDGGARGAGSNCGSGMKTPDACQGGSGGSGGQGGQGGGGFGGHSIGIAFKKGTAAPNIMEVDIQTGTAGNGGAGADAAGNGGNGVKDNTHELN